MERLCGQCAWCDDGRYCRRTHKDVPYFGVRTCYTTHEEFRLLFAQEVTKSESELESNRNSESKKESKMETPTTKVCKDCGRELPIENFQRQAKSRDGYMHICKECKSKRVLTGVAKDKDISPSLAIKEKLNENMQKVVSLTIAEDKELVAELRSRGWDVKCTKTLEL